MKTRRFFQTMGWLLVVLWAVPGWCGTIGNLTIASTGHYSMQVSIGQAIQVNATAGDRIQITLKASAGIIPYGLLLYPDGSSANLPGRETAANGTNSASIVLPETGTYTYTIHDGAGNSDLVSMQWDGTSGGSDSATAPQRPVLTVSQLGQTIAMNWPAAAGATGYRLIYFPKDFSFIGNFDIGTANSLSIPLWSGASFYVAIMAYNDMGNSELSNVESFSIP
jgi:hypothetical protein